MLLLLGIAFLAGVIVAVSPCVLPVLPIVLAGSAAGGTRRPFAVIGGLVLSFAVFTLFGVWLLDQLGLPDDLLRNVGIGLLFLVAAMLVVPPLGQAVERSLSRLGRRPGGDAGGGFLLGVSLGPVFVPCAGPVLAALATNAARLEFGWRTLAVMVAYSLGLAAPMFLLALAGREAIERTRALKQRLARLRPALGVVIAGAAVVIALGYDIKLATHVPSYVKGAQDAIERSAAAAKQLNRLRGGATPAARAASQAAVGPELADYGRAPDFRGISHWLNTGERPLSLRALRGKVVLVDFWTYSCINCLRTLPYLKAWYATYAKDGFVIVGVHTPEFAFEHVLSNVRRASRELGVRYPVALDNDYATWNAYYNQYWPAEYLLDRKGHLRHAHFGEGEYEHTERLIRTLLAERSRRLPRAVDLPDRTPAGLITPETYLGADRIDLVRYVGPQLAPGESARYSPQRRLGQNEFAYSGYWRIEDERAVAVRDSRLLLAFHARKVHLVLGGRGAVEVFLNGTRTKRVAVDEDRLYTLVELPRIEDGLLELRFSPGVAGYAFTFG